MSRQRRGQAPRRQPVGAMLAALSVGAGTLGIAGVIATTRDPEKGTLAASALLIGGGVAYALYLASRERMRELVREERKGRLWSARRLEKLLACQEEIINRLARLVRIQRDAGSRGEEAWDRELALTMELGQQMERERQRQRQHKQPRQENPGDEGI